MVTAQSANQVFLELKNDPQNQLCIDCGSQEATIASISYGIFICPSCSAAHESLGVEVSFRKPLASETWSLKQLKLMATGGNSELQSFLTAYGIPAGAPPEYKYNTVAAKYYRDRLLATAEGLNYEMPQPTPKEGLTLLRHFAPPAPERSGGISGFLSSAFSTVKSAGSSALSKAQEVGPDALSSTWSFLSSAGSAVKSGAEWTIDKGRVISENSAVQSALSTVKSSATSAASLVGDVAVYTYDSVRTNSHVQHMSEGASRQIAELEQKVRGDASSIYSRLVGSGAERPNTPPEYQ
jgi:hypothetical protein